MRILITGTSSGIGYGLAKNFLKQNAEVLGISRREPKDLLKHPHYHHLSIDLTRPGDLNKLLPGFLSDTDRLDRVILNSGVLGEIKYMKETSLEEMKAVMEINVWANKSLLDLLFNLNINIEQVVGISSGAALRSTPGWGSYALSKAGLDMLMNIYAKEYPETHFSAFAPGLVDTQMQDYIYQIEDVEKYPSAKNLQQARYTDEMPDPVSAASKLIRGMEKALEYDSGSHVDVREMGL
ncbi:MAG: SDR family NAD(P)-dependent oxidoreductase [bacterium]